MRATIRAFVAVAMISVSLGLSIAPAAACSCAGGTDRQAFDRADAVFTGSLISYDYEEDPDGDGLISSGDPAFWTFEVDLVFKGTVEPEQVVVSAVSGATCGLEIPHEGEFVVFARDTDPFEGFFDLPQGTLGADLCGGTRSIVDEPPKFEATGSPPTAPEATVPTPTDGGAEILPDEVSTPTTPPAPTTTPDDGESEPDPESGGIVLVIGFITVGIAAAFVAARLARRSRAE